jgi:hypothetical protein
MVRLLKNTFSENCFPKLRLLILFYRLLYGCNQNLCNVTAWNSTIYAKSIEESYIYACVCIEPNVYFKGWYLVNIFASIFCQNRMSFYCHGNYINDQILYNGKLLNHSARDTISITKQRNVCTANTSIGPSIEVFCTILYFDLLFFKGTVRPD